MCGIVGAYAGEGELLEPSSLLEMAGELSHRGPDGAGLYLDGRFAMANTRLAIIDIEGGDQPLSNEDGRYWVMQNGEIYNYPELTFELKALGHEFSTRSDTEVLVHAFEEWGPACLEKLNGEFAFAIWDRRARELFLARDRFGIRPLFLAERRGGLFFASEIKALVRHPSIRRELDPSGIVEFFSLWTTLPDRSCFKEVRELPPGHYLIARPNGSIDQRRWWDIPFSRSAEADESSSTEIAAKIAWILEDATRIRLRADVPVGVYVSGGLDSSATAAFARRCIGQRLQGFGVGFEDSRFDEGVHQEAIAKTLDIELSRLVVGGSHIAAAFPKVVLLAESPMLRTAPAPLLHLSGLVRDSGFKVVLTGEGADELFAGYNIFRETMVRRFWSRQPSSTARPLLLRRLYQYLPRGLGSSGRVLESFFGMGLHETNHPLYSHLIRFKNSERSLRLFRREILDAAHHDGSPRDRLISRLPRGFSDLGGLSRAQYLEIHTFMQGYLLHGQGDRMLMGSSIEGRFPFLDYRLAELAARIPERLRLRGMREKHILRKAVSPLLPKEMTERDKRPYRAPILDAFIGRLAPDYVGDILRPQSIEEAGIFEPLAVENLLKKCRRSIESGVSETDEMALVGVLSTMLLHEQMVRQPKLAQAVRPRRVVIGSQLAPWVDPRDRAG